MSLVGLLPSGADTCHQEGDVIGKLRRPILSTNIAESLRSLLLNAFKRVTNSAQSSQVNSIHLEDAETFLVN